MFAILDLPKGTFLGTGVQTVVLFFKKGEPTKNIWYYKLNPGRNMGKTNSLNENDLENFIKLSKNKKESDDSWSISIDKVNLKTLDLTVNNPNKVEEIDNRTPEEIILEIEKLNKEEELVLQKIKKLI